MAEDFVVLGGEQLGALAKQFRAAGPEGKQFRKALRRDLKAVAEPMVREIKANAAAIPSQNRGSTGLRAGLVHATKTSIRASGKNAYVRVMVDPKRMPAGQQNLPVLMDGQRPWRHPVFGHRQVWVDQQAHPFFQPVVDKAGPAATEAAIAAMTEVETQLQEGI